jgi:chemotaxis protein methyltransferase CheR
MACTDADLAYLRAAVLEHASNTLDPARDYLFESRLRPLVKAKELASLAELVAVLRRRPDPATERRIAEAMTVKETSFFRDRAPFELMRRDLLPALVRRREGCRSLRLWSAGCSTGQEAYSLATMLKENFPELRDWKVEILGTDLAADVVARARTGRYQRLEVNRGLPERSLLKHMRRVGEEWEMVPEIKRLCRFYQQNLCRGLLLFEPYDGILLRNVMIYFPAEMRRELLLSMHRILAPDGFLILGASEQPGLPEYFEPILAWGACYYKPVVNAQKE